MIFPFTCARKIACNPWAQANSGPARSPSTIRTVAQASASMQVSYSTLTEARAFTAGPPERGFIVCDTRNLPTVTKCR